jgi:hypothetical protein
MSEPPSDRRQRDTFDREPNDSRWRETADTIIPERWAASSPNDGRLRIGLAALKRFVPAFQAR